MTAETWGDERETLINERDAFLVELAISETRCREKLKEVTEQRDRLLAVSANLVANLPDEIFEWIGDSISWSNVSAIKSAREATADAIESVKGE